MNAKNSLKFLLLSFILCASSNFLFSQNNSTTVQGKVINIRADEPIPFLVIIADNGVQEYKALSNENGDFLFKNLPLGNYQISSTSIYFKSKTLSINLQKQLYLTLALEPSQRVLDELYITASESRGMTSSSTIDKKAMEHLQPSSFTDLLELLPGGRSIDPQLTVMNQIRLREVGVQSSAYDISSLGTAFYIDGAPINTTANMQSTNKFTLTDPNGSRNSTNRGVDMRSIPTDQIDKVEIIRGIPSVEYGDLTSGLIEITRKKGSTPYSVRIKTDGFSKLISVGKGFSVPKHHLFVNADIDFLNSKADPRDNFENYKRLNGSIRMEKFWENSIAKLTWNTAFDYGTTIDNERSDPDNSYDLTDNYTSQYNRLSLYNNLTYKLLNNKVVKTIQLSTKLSYERDNLNLTKWVQARSASILPNSLLSGAYDASFLTPSYAAKLSVLGEPLTAFIKAKADLGFNSGKINHQMKVGVETNYSKNFGAGQVYDLDYPPSPSISARPRAFSSIPAMHNISFFAEDQMHLLLGSQRFNLSTGIRGMGLMNMNKSFAIANKIFLDPRINVKWVLPKMKINDKNVLLTFGGGYGLHTKLPTLNHLYPNPNYVDIVQLNFYHNNPEYRKANVMTYILDETNYNLDVAVNKKWELNTDVNVQGNRLSITYFREKMSSGFRSSSAYKALDYRKYNNTSIDASNLTNQPSLSDFGFEDRREFAGYSINSNGSTLNKEGIEYQFITKRISSINTRITVNGAWFKSTYSNSQPVYKIISSTVVTNNKIKQYVGIYEDDEGSVRQQFNSNIILDSYLPKLGLTLSSSIQNLWFTSRKANYKSGTPIQYIDINEKVHPYTDADQSNMDLQWLNTTYNESNFRKYTVPIDLQVNLKATKEFKNKVKVAMFVNRILTYTPNYTSYRTPVRRQGFDYPYFGMELNFTL